MFHYYYYYLNLILKNIKNLNFLIIKNFNIPKHKSLYPTCEEQKSLSSLFGKLNDLFVSFLINFVRIA